MSESVQGIARQSRAARLGVVVVLAVCGLDLAPAAAADGWVEVVGEARSIKGNDLLYTEHHRIHRSEGLPTRHLVSYRNADGQDFATKQIDYGRSVSSPAFEMTDSRDGYVEGARFEDERYLLYRIEPGKEEKTRELEFGPDLVTDAGFDAYVRQHIGRVLDGERLRFRLGLAGALRSVNFRARLIERFEDPSGPAARIRVEPDSLLRFLIDPLELVYSLQPLQLRAYRGRTNIRDVDGDAIDAVIRFDDETPAEAPVLPPNKVDHEDD